MEDFDKYVKVYSENYNLLCGGLLLSMKNGIIMLKGNNLPIIETKTKVIIEVYGDLSGIAPYLCEISISSPNQLNAKIKRAEPIIERRNALKVRTDLFFEVNSLYRNDINIDDLPKITINILNLSVGGMLISSSYDFMINDIFDFKFKHNDTTISLTAKIIRIDKKYDKFTKELSGIYYGCSFEKMSNFSESVITKYLYDRQLQLYRNE